MLYIFAIAISMALEEFIDLDIETVIVARNIEHTMTFLCTDTLLASVMEGPLRWRGR